MTKAELINKIAEKGGITKKDAGKALNAMIETVKEALKNGDKIAIAGFGSFSVSFRKEKEGRNPKTGEKIKIPASAKPKFTPGKDLKEAVAKLKPPKN